METLDMDMETRPNTNPVPNTTRHRNTRHRNTRHRNTRHTTKQRTSPRASTQSWTKSPPQWTDSPPPPPPSPRQSPARSWRRPQSAPDQTAVPDERWAFHGPCGVERRPPRKGAGRDPTGPRPAPACTNPRVQSHVISFLVTMCREAGTGRCRIVVTGLDVSSRSQRRRLELERQPDGVWSRRYVRMGQCVFPNGYDVNDVECVAQIRLWGWCPYPISLSVCRPDGGGGGGGGVNVANPAFQGLVDAIHADTHRYTHTPSDRCGRVRYTVSVEVWACPARLEAHPRAGRWSTRWSSDEANANNVVCVTSTYTR